MPLILGAQSATATGFSIDNSCRFDQGSSAFLNLTFGTPTDGHIWNYSCWVKRTNLGTAAATQTALFCDNGVPDARIYFREDDWRVDGYYGGGTGAYIFETTQVFRDPSAWYHVCVLWDDTQTVADNRVKLYINGTQVTVFDSETQPNQNTLHTMNSAIQHFVGRIKASHYTNCYMAQACFVDGTVYTISDFGEFNEDSPTIWQPIDVSELTFGDNGFLLDFADSADLGKDVSGKGNDWTSNGLAAADQATDSPTNNFATLNPESTVSYKQGSGANQVYTEGNTKVVENGGLYKNVPSTLASFSGKWYCELKFVGTVGGSLLYSTYGGVLTSHDIANIGDTYNHVGQTAQSVGYGAYDGDVYTSDTGTTYGNTLADGDILGIALDLDNSNVYFSKNGVWQNSGDPESGATGTGAASLPASDSSWHFGASPTNSTIEANFGGSSGFAITSANQDANGYGNFEYAVPSGYYAMCTKNLAEFGG